LAQYDLVGLQAERDVSRLMEAFRSRDDAEVIDEHVVRFGPNRVFAESFPIGIDADAFVRNGRNRGLRAVRLADGERLVIGVDRLDYTKGIPQRFQAFERLLELREDLAGQVSLLQIAPPTRGEMPPIAPSAMRPSSCRAGSTGVSPISTGRRSATSTAPCRASGSRICSGSRRWGWSRRWPMA
jgi:trehalose-6-phosphate synthase